MFDYLMNPPLMYLVRQPRLEDTLEDLPLTTAEQHVAEQTAMFVHFAAFGKVISSDFTRCRQLAEIIDPNYEVETYLRPAFDEIETPEEFHKRWKPTFEELVEASSTANKPLVLVTHAQNLAVLTRYLDSTSPEDVEMVIPGGVVALKKAEDGKLYLEPLLGKK